jgi:hypothetical protein
MVATSRLPRLIAEVLPAGRCAMNEPRGRQAVGGVLGETFKRMVSNGKTY